MARKKAILISFAANFLRILQAVQFFDNLLVQMSNFEILDGIDGFTNDKESDMICGTKFVIL